MSFRLPSRPALAAARLRPQLRPVLLLLLASLSLLFRGAVAGIPTDYYNLTLSPCHLTFAAFEASLPYTRDPQYTLPFAIQNQPVSVLPYQSLAVLCPAHCTAETGAGQLLGSYPYAAPSSICLAGIHSGIISAAAGGGVFVSRFYRHDWSNSSTQTIFPFSSSSGSLSNGVQSLPVPAAWYSVPSTAREWSYAVRGRGEPVVQRRQAPFPPRAGHLQFTVTDGLSVNVSSLQSLHFVMGGHNASHYLNDVWLAVDRQLQTEYVDLEWTRLADAPFSPRSHMIVRQLSWNSQALYADLLIAGGQTGHLCGLLELGVCSSEAWDLEVWLNEDGSPHLQWLEMTPETVQLPSPARCQPALATDDRDWPLINAIITGGQLSYTDESCRAQPETVSEQWGLRFNVQGMWVVQPWTRQADAPFSPRRFETSECSPHCTTMGGVRYRSIRTLPSGLARLTAVDLFADIWLCLPSANRSSPSCFWDSSVPYASLPLPVAQLPYSPFMPFSWDAVSFPLWGGIGARDSYAEWQRTPPLLEQDAERLHVRYNMSALPSNLSFVYSPAWPFQRTLANVTAGRGNLSLSATLDEDEINDPAGYYSLGTPWLIANLRSEMGDAARWDYSYPRTSLFSLQQQPNAMALQPSESTWFLPQAASSLNTTRPLFNFPLARLSHRASVAVIRTQSFTQNSEQPGLFDWIGDRMSVGGGRSGSTYSSDWITVHQPRCLPPTDPSFASLLGAMELTLWPYCRYSNFADYPGFLSASMLPELDYPSPWQHSSVLKVGCRPGFHFEPPSRNAERELFCGPNGVWLDISTQSVRSCARDTLPCSWPLADLGGVSCEPMEPLLQRLDASYTDWQGQQRSVGRSSNVSLTGWPLLAGVTLTISGSAFCEPLAVTLDAHTCAGPRLVDCPGKPVSTVTYWTSTDPDSTEQKRVTSRCGCAILCELPVFVSGQLSLTLTTGVLGEEPLVDPEAGNEATVSSMAPLVTGLQVMDARDCEQGGPLVLLGCPRTRAFNVWVCAALESVGNAELSLSVVTTVGTAANPSPWINPNLVSCERYRPLDGRLAGERCANCTLYPRIGEGRVGLLQTSLGASSAQATSVAFVPCAAGQRADAELALLGNASSVCSPCPAGSSTEGNVQANQCSPCAAGYFANGTGAATCSPCPPGAHAPLPGSIECQPCPLNSYANSTAQTRCETCELDQYIVYGGPGQRGIVGHCLACVDGAVCDPDGSISAQPGSYLIIDQDAGTVSSVSCPASACVQAKLNSAVTNNASGSAYEAIASSQLRVVNQCSSGRWPAYNSDPAVYADEETLRVTGGHNVLCASCLPGHSCFNGQCVPCPGVDGGALVGTLLLSLLLVYLVHRLPHDWSGSATLMISSNFLQLSVQFLGYESASRLLGLLNVNLLGEHMRYGQAAQDSRAMGACVLPLDDAGRMLVALLSPAIAFGLLGCVAATHVTTRLWLQRRAAVGRPPSRKAVRVYRALFVPSIPSLPPSDAGRLPSSELSTLPEVGSRCTQSDGEQSALPEAAAFTLSLEPRQALAVSYQRSLVRLLLLSYTSLTALSFSAFHWQSVGSFGLRLVDYPTLRPDSPQYGRLLPLMALLMAAVVCGLPVALAVYLLLERRAGRLAAVKAVQHGEAAADAGPGRSALLLQLTAMFRPSCWWMASAVYLRRLLLIATLTWERGPVVWVWLSLLNWTLLLLHVHVRPYERARDNSLETLVLLTLSLQTTLLSAYPPPDRSALLRAALNASIIAPLLPVLMRATRRAVNECRKRADKDSDEGAAANDADEDDTGDSVKPFASLKSFRHPSPSATMRQPLL